MRRKRVEELRSIVRDGPKPKPLINKPSDDKSKRQKNLDLLAGVVSSDDESNDGDASGDQSGDAGLLDWRAKTM